MTHNLPFVDTHEVRVAAPPLETWIAVGRVLDSRFSGAGAEAYARLIGCEDTTVSGSRPFRPGSTLVGFHVVDAKPPQELVLEGAHRFSQYRLTCGLERDGAGTRLRATTHARFPGLFGSAYRTAVVGSRVHVLLVNRLLRQVRAVAESR